MFADDYETLHNMPASGTRGPEVVLIIVMILAGLYTLRTHRRYRSRSSAHIGSYYRYTYLATAANIAGYVAIILSAFSIRQVVGYHETEQWSWLDTAYSYQPVYAGEGWAVVFIYIAPWLWASARYAVLGHHARKVFGGVFLNMYPWMVVATYLGFFAVSLFLPQDVQQHIFNRPVIDVGEP
ncbi:MAG: hypothetical protein EOP51_06310 [Sphingobacteriales bacterium]|nr:MAG: hypothetical protein EOP51_06310 [Sphingobacteriales bacterium]